MPHRLACLLASLALLLLVGQVRAGVGDPTIQTDHPDYAGEGAFQTVDQCVRAATAGMTGSQEKAIALYLWILSHQYHLASPQEWCYAGKVPNVLRSDNDMLVLDAERARFSYGYALCGTVHAWNEVYWRALGMRARCRSFPGHTNSEIEYDGAWHAFDTDMAGLVFRKDGIVAGYEDIIKDLSLLDIKKSPLPQYPFAWPSDFDSMKSGWKEVAKGGNWYKMYNTAYAAQPGIVALRAGETFTRYFDPDHFGGPAKRRFWHVQKGGPFRDWTFVNMGTPTHDGPKSNSRGNASYCNGEFVYRPDLTAPSFRQGVAEKTDNVARVEGAPGLRSNDGAKASITFQHFSPYVIAGCPADGVNPMTAAATGGLVVTGEAKGTLTLEVSPDLGQTWKSATKVSGKFDVDLTDEVKGRYAWRVRFTWDGQSGLDAVTFTTVTQVSQAIYPRLKPDGSSVIYRAASRMAVPVLPNFAASEDVVSRFEEKSWRTPNVVYAAQKPNSRLAYAVQGNKAGSIVFRVDSPADLLEVTAAARYNVRVPRPEDCEYHLDISTDGGRNWKLLARADVPKDNEFSSGWVYGSADVAAAKTRGALVRVTLYQGGYNVGLIAAEFYGIAKTPPPQALTLTYAWKEGGMVKTQTEKVPAGSAEWKFTVPTGKTITDEYVRLEAP
jgi:hypothetical protein